jgi:prepilin-type N-terminal cleavage/methylation domain-containing protein
MTQRDMSDLLYKIAVRFDHGDRLSRCSGTPGEGLGDGDFERETIVEIPNHPHPNPLPVYRERGQDVPSRRNNRSAFTLIEVIIVVVILAILAAIALPSLATQNDLTADAAARVVIGDLLYAQSQAIATGQNQYVSFSLTGSGSYNLSSPMGTVITDPVTKQPYAQTFGSGNAGPLVDSAIADLTLDSTANTVLVFNELGQPYVCPPYGTPVALANTGTIVLQCGISKVTLSIEPATGNITVSP